MNKDFLMLNLFILINAFLHIAFTGFHFLITPLIFMASLPLFYISFINKPEKEEFKR